MGRLWLVSGGREKKNMWQRCSGGRGARQRRGSCRCARVLRHVLAWTGGGTRAMGREAGGALTQGWGCGGGMAQAGWYGTGDRSKGRQRRIACQIDQWGMDLGSTRKRGVRLSELLQCGIQIQMHGWCVPDKGTHARKCWGHKAPAVLGIGAVWQDDRCWANGSQARNLQRLMHGSCRHVGTVVLAGTACRRRAPSAGRQRRQARRRHLLARAAQQLGLGLQKSNPCAAERGPAPAQSSGCPRWLQGGVVRGVREQSGQHRCTGITSSAEGAAAAGACLMH